MTAHINFSSAKDPNLVTIIIRSPRDGLEMEYVLPKSAACYYSPVLDAALNSTFLEGQTQTYTIDDFNYPLTFGVIQKWMETQTLDAAGNVGSGKDSKRFDLYCTWVFADRLMITELQNQIIEPLCIHDTGRNITAQWLYDNTGEGSKIRKFFIGGASRQELSSLKKIKASLDELPPEFLLDIILALKCTRGRGFELRPRDFFVGV